MSNTKRASKTAKIRLLAMNLQEARTERNFKRSKAIGAELAPLLSNAYWNHPEVFTLPVIRDARRYVAWLRRAQYIEQPKSCLYRGGSPGLGKRA